MSKQKDAMLQVIRGSCKHMSADEIYMECKKQNVNVSIATVYRNLTSLVKEGIIRKIEMANGSDIYDRNMIPHEHIICDCCKKVSDLPHVDITQYLEETLSLKLLSYELCLHYVCDDCLKKQKKGKR